MPAATALLAILFLRAPEGELRALGGPEPAPLRAPHLPRPLDEYLFRNWGAAPVERMAAAIGARESDLRALARELGLGDPPEVAPEAWRRSYLTVIRRNWHLLPYDQLLRLLGWDEARLARTLLEDDFLWVKLGSLKPRCPPVAFEPIPEALRPRSETIRRTAEEVLGPRGLAGFRPRFAFLDELRARAEIRRPPPGPAGPGEVDLGRGGAVVLPAGAGPVARAAAERFSRYLREVWGAEAGAAAPVPGAAAVPVELSLAPEAFARAEAHEVAVEPGRIRITARDEEGLLRGLDRLKDRMEERGGPYLEPGAERRETRFSLRFLHSYFSLYGDPLIEPDLDPYPEGYLEKLSRVGVNGVWMQALLANLAPEPAPGAPAFPGVAAGSARRLEALRALVERARRYGIGVYLYLNEPRSLPRGQVDGRPELGGVSEGSLRALCTSVAAVREQIAATLAHVLLAVPDLAGVFTITMSENLTSCWSHGKGKDCPRCGERPGPEVVAEVNGAVLEGVRRARARARVIAWDWGWPDDWIEPIAGLLPAGVDLMSVSEWSLPIRRGGVESVVGEYSISAVGPGPRAARTWAAARRTARASLAKIQANNTWELSSVPYIPAVRLVAEHVERLSRAGVDGLMLGWTLGGYPSPNLEAAAEWYFEPAPALDSAVARVARRRFARAGEGAARAWRAFGEAFREFPFHVGLVYTAPLQLGPANLLLEGESGYRATMIGFPYDDLETWRSIYPSEVMAAQLQTVAREWEKGLSELRDDPALDPLARVRLTAERRVAQAALLHFKSAAAQARFVHLRRAYVKEREPRAALALLDSLRGIVLSEIGSARQLLAIVREDSRIGFEASNHYYYLPGDLAEKVVNCRWLIEDWIAAERRRWEGRG